MNRQSGIVPDFGPKGIPGPNSKGQNANHAFNTRLDSMKQEFQAHQKRIHSKKTVLSTGEITVDITQTWSGGAWVNSSLDSIITNSYGEQLEYVNESWYNNGWVNYYRDFYTYDANGRETSALNQTGNGTAWVNSNQEFWTYDGNGHETSDMTETWSGSAWVNSNQ